MSRLAYLRLLSVAVFLVPFFAQAATVSLFPGKIEVEVIPGQALTRSITVVNQGSEVASYRALVSNLLEETNPQFDASKYVQLTETNFELRPQERKSLTFRINLPPKTPVQSYHAAILIETKAQTGTANSFLRIGSLIFIRTAGERKELGRTTAFKVLGGPLIFHQGSIKTVINFTNEGNTYLNPYGVLTINTVGGRELGYAKIDPWYVLPGQSRIRDLNLKNPGVGLYRFDLNLNRGYNNIIDRKSHYVVIWSWPWALLGLGLIFLLVVMLIRLIIKRKMRVI